MHCFEYNVDPYQPASQKVTDQNQLFTTLPLNQPYKHKWWKIGYKCNVLMCSTVQERITTCGRNAIVKLGERTNIRPQKHPHCSDAGGEVLQIPYRNNDSCCDL